VELPRGGSISQEVKPEDEMAVNSQNGDIIVLSVGFEFRASHLLDRSSTTDPLCQTFCFSYFLIGSFIYARFGLYGNAHISHFPPSLR
jgi:hypothetical protein